MEGMLIYWLRDSQLQLPEPVELRESYTIEQAQLLEEALQSTSEMLLSAEARNSALAGERYSRR
jgi:hypothetical protein